jgi:hypothetical protein
MLTFGFALPKTNAILRLNLLNLKACNLLIVYIGTYTAYISFTTSDERDCPLNLSISLSGEKENNNDS